MVIKMDILEELIGDKQDYKCFNLLIELFNQNEEFRNIIIEGYNKKMIMPFSEEIWNEIRNQNIREINSFEDVFKYGYNIGNCTWTSKQLSYSFDNIFICGGTNRFLENTQNSKDGTHTWILNNNYIIDTSLMLLIHKDYQNILGYNEENKYNPMDNQFYRISKDFATDPNFKKPRK